MTEEELVGLLTFKPHVVRNDDDGSSEIECPHWLNIALLIAEIRRIRGLIAEEHEHAGDQLQNQDGRESAEEAGARHGAFKALGALRRKVGC